MKDTGEMFRVIKNQEDEIRARIFANLSFLISVSYFFSYLWKGEEKLGGFLVDFYIVGL